MPEITDGVPGLEALHTLTPPAAFPTFTLNDWMADDGSTQLPHTRLQKIVGIHDKPDADDPRVQLVYQPGELPLPRLQRGRSITYTGVIVGSTLSEMRAKEAALRAAVSSGSDNPLAWYLSVGYNGLVDSALVFKGWGIPVGFTCDDDQPNPDTAPTPWQRVFDLTFRQSDGRWWVVNDDALCSVGSADTPIDDGSNGTLTMTGTAPSEPIFTVYGSGSGEATIVLTATEVNAVLTIDLPDALPSGKLLVVDFGQRTITFDPAGDADDYTGYIDWTASTWWNEADVAATLLIGDNTLSVVGDPWSATALPAVW